MPEDGETGDVIADAVESGAAPTPPTGGDPVPGPSEPAGEPPPPGEGPETAGPPEPESGPFEKLFLEPADTRPSEIMGHPIVELIQEGIDQLAQNPREAFAYLAKCGVVTLEKFGVPAGGRKALPAGFYVVIGIFVVLASLVFGTSDEDEGEESPVEGFQRESGLGEVEDEAGA